MSVSLRRVWYEILNTIFPCFCIGCNVEGTVFCVDCENTLDISGVFCCPVCHSAGYGYPCEACIAHTVLARHVAVASFAPDSLMYHAIHALKYQYIEEFGAVFDGFIDRFVQKNQIYTSVSYIVPVPLHRKRFVERGFNQSSIIARSLSHYTGIPVLDALSRVKYTRQQAKLSRQKRVENMKQAFDVLPSVIREVQGATVLVVDDVYTTGSTIEACAVALYGAGVARVEGFTLARG